jgi:hypothetical protein
VTKAEQLEKLRIARIRVQDAKRILVSLFGEGLLLTSEISTCNELAEDLEAIRNFQESKA